MNFNVGDEVVMYYKAEVDSRGRVRRPRVVVGIGVVKEIRGNRVYVGSSVYDGETGERLKGSVKNACIEKRGG